MKLKTIKTKNDKLFRDYFLKLIKELKKVAKLPDKTIFYLGIHNHCERFLCGNKIYVVFPECLSGMEFEKIGYLKVITLLKDDINSVDDFKFEVIIENDQIIYTDDDFLLFLQKPCDITEKIDLSFSKILKFFRNYKTNQFKTKNYIFYPKLCNDFIYINSIFAKNIKNGHIMRLYISNFENKIPEKLQDYTVEEITQNAPYYEKLKCKKEFIKLSKEYNEELQTENFWVIHLLAQAVNTTYWLHEWSVHRIFAGQDNKFSNIWCDDFLGFDEKPYFFLTDNQYSWKTNRVAVLDFKEPRYKTKGIYKQNNVKFLHWELDKENIQALMEYLQQPFDKKIYGFEKESEIKTNWQILIYEYNTNTAGYYYEDGTGCEDYEVLPLDLPMPDYLKLLEEK